MGKLKHSCFFITVNSNQSPLEIEKIEEELERIKLITEGIISRKFIENIIIFEQGNLSEIKDIESHCGCELGKKNDKIHAHMIIHISHYAKIKLDYAKIKEEYNKIYTKGVYFWSKIIPYKKTISFDNVISYINKNEVLMKQLKRFSYKEEKENEEKMDKVIEEKIKKENKKKIDIDKLIDEKLILLEERLMQKKSKKPTYDIDVIVEEKLKKIKEEKKIKKKGNPEIKNVKEEKEKEVKKNVYSKDEENFLKKLRRG